MDQDVVIYIHGISPDEDLAILEEMKARDNLTDISDPQRKVELSHQEEYGALKDGVARYIGDESKRKTWNQAAHCFTEWGWEYREDDASNLGASHRLKDAQHSLGQRIIDAIKSSYCISLIPQTPIRKLALYGLSDVFYYVSHDGRYSIRVRICYQIANCLDEILEDPSADVSLTVIGHSAGSVIALDLVDYLFTDDEYFPFTDPDLDIEKRMQIFHEINDLESDDPAVGHRKIDAVQRDSFDAEKRLAQLREMTEDGRLTLKRLITMGSPISMLILRSDRRIRDLAYGGRVSPSSVGIDGSGEKPDDPAWVNIWNKYDPISFPVAPIMEEGAPVTDFHVRVAWNPLKSHTGYWTSKNVHRLLARFR